MYAVVGKMADPRGKPLTELAGSLVIFQSVDGRVSSQGQVGSDGSFRMGTLSNSDGMRPGTYRVMIAPPPPAVALDARPVPTLLPPRYHSFATSGWEVTVEPKPNAFTFTAERATADQKQ